jgi:hypothetical protein
MAYRLSSFKPFKVCAGCVHSFENVFHHGYIDTDLVLLRLEGMPHVK